MIQILKVTKAAWILNVILLVLSLSASMARAADLFAWVTDGSLRVRVGATFSLAEAASAHRALEGRATTGKVLLLPAN